MALSPRAPWPVPPLFLVLVGACLRPEGLPLPPQPERALGALWDLNGAYWGAGLDPPANFLSLEAPYEVQVAYFGCDNPELAGTPAGERGCRPTTQVGFRLDGAEPSWAPIDPAEAVGCECADLDPYVLRQSAPLIDDEDTTKLAGATLLPGDGALPDVLLAFIERSRTVHYRVHGEDRRTPEGEPMPATLVLTSTIPRQSGALWAENDGTVWSAGSAGLYRADGLAERLVWERIPFAAARTQDVSPTQVRLAPVSMDPLRLLMVEAGGLTLLWDRSGVTELQPNRGLDNASNLRGDRADIAPLYERGEQRGWVLLGPAPPVLPANDDWQNAAYVVYRDGALGPALPLLRVQSVAGSKELGTFGIDSNAGLFSLGEAGATPRELGVSLATPKLLRIFDGHFVLSPEKSPVVHYERIERGCTGRGNDLGEVTHIFPMGDLLVEVGFLGQVRWSRARSICNLRKS